MEVTCDEKFAGDDEDAPLRPPGSRVTRQRVRRLSGAAALSSVLMTAVLVLVNQSGRVAGIAAVGYLPVTVGADPATGISGISAAQVTRLDVTEVVATYETAADAHPSVVSERPRAVRHNVDRVRDFVRGAAAPPAENASTCLTRDQAAAMTIVIPDISYSCPVYAGDQSMLDSGAVTLISRALGASLAARPGDAGILWIAAHRESHGGAFLAVPDLADGSIITVTDADATVRYRVVGRVDAQVDGSGWVIDGGGQGTRAATTAAIVGPGYGPGSSRLVLQTCAGSAIRVMIYADMITG